MTSYSTRSRNNERYVANGIAAHYTKSPPPRRALFRTVRSQHSFRDIISVRQKKIDSSVQYRVVEIDDVLALDVPLSQRVVPN
jgi:hypothetical protein